MALTRNEAITVAGARVVDVELAVARELRMERNAQQSLLTAESDQRTDVEKRCRQQRSAAQDTNPTGLIDHVQLRRAVAGLHDVDGVRGATNDELGFHRQRRNRGVRQECSEARQRRDEKTVQEKATAQPHGDSLAFAPSRAVTVPGLPPNRLRRGAATP
jgi:hypothetical protein